MALCWFISLTFCAVLWKLHSFLTVIYNYHQRQVIFLPWSILLHIYAIVFIMISRRQMEFFFFNISGVGKELLGYSRGGRFTLLLDQGAHHGLVTHLSKAWAGTSSIFCFPLPDFFPILWRNMTAWYKESHGKLQQVHLFQQSGN